MATNLIANSQNQVMKLTFDSLIAANKRGNPEGKKEPSKSLVESDQGLTPLQGATFAFWLLLTTNNTSSELDYTSSELDHTTPKKPFSFEPSNLLYRLAPMFKNLRGDRDRAIEAKFATLRDLLANDGMEAEVTMTDANNVRTKITAFVPYGVGVQIARDLFSKSSEMGDETDEGYEAGQICDGDGMFMDLIPKDK